MESSTAYNNLGMAYTGMGQIEEAIEAYEEALDLDPESPAIAKNLSEAYRARKMLKFFGLNER